MKIAKTYLPRHRRGDLLIEEVLLLLFISVDQNLEGIGFKRILIADKLALLWHLL
jgi:hypothetical protein